MRQNIIFVISLSGTTVYMLYILTYCIAKKYFPALWRYRLLKISLAFFLVPLPYYNPMMERILTSVFPFLKNETAGSGMHIIDELNIIIKNCDSFFLSENAKKIWIIALMSGAISFTIILFRLFKYAKTKSICLNHGAITPPAFLLDKLEAMKVAMGVKTNVKLILSEFIRQPIVIGLFKPILVLPLLDDDHFALQEWDFVIKHELTHIKSKDLLTRFAGLLVMAIHWFNPVCYFIFREIICISEICCDDYVMKNEDSNKKKEYCQFIVSLASENKPAINGMFSVGLISNNFCTIKRRMLEMKFIKKTGKKALSYFICGVICVMGAVTSFAYEAPVTMGIADNEAFAFNENATYAATIGGEDSFEEIPYDRFFTYESGNVFEMPEIETKPKPGCFHDFEAGTVTEHTAKSDGGCSTKYYRAKICVYCNYIICGELYDIQTNMSCPH